MARKRDLPASPKTADGAFVPPYPPSWFDRFTAWVDRLPGPARASYLILAGRAVVAALLLPLAIWALQQLLARFFAV